MTGMDLRTGIVQSVSAAKVKVRVDGVDVDMPYVGTPVLSKKAWVLRQGSTWVCLGTPNGA